MVGSGPNGLSAAIALAGAGKSVYVVEANETIGGGSRSLPLTLPGFIHDICSEVHPLAAGSPFFRSLPLKKHGLNYLHPTIPLAHPFDDGTAALLHRSLADTVAGLESDGAAYGRLMGPLVRRADYLTRQLLGPFRPPIAHPFAMARFGLPSLRSAAGLARGLFTGEHGRALFAGMGAHSMLSLRRRPTAGFSILLAMAAHAYGWPFARGGSQSIADALVSVLQERGGTVAAGSRITSMEQLRGARVVLFDLTPRDVASIAGDELTPSFKKNLEHFRYGEGVFKVDWALESPIPWHSGDCRRAGTVHLGGTFEEVLDAEDAVASGTLPERPFVILAQPTLFDPTRAPAGKHIGWAYCHVPGGSSIDMTARIEAQVERFAPGFSSRIIGRQTLNAVEMERHNANYVGGDINAGIADLRQFFIRPTWRLYATSNAQIYICSASTPPGGGVHGMCGAWAARTALRRAAW